MKTLIWISAAFLLCSCATVNTTKPHREYTHLRIENMEQWLKDNDAEKLLNIHGKSKFADTGSSASDNVVHVQAGETVTIEIGE